MLKMQILCIYFNMEQASNFAAARTVDAPLTGRCAPGKINLLTANIAVLYFSIWPIIVRSENGQVIVTSVLVVQGNIWSCTPTFVCRRRPTPNMLCLHVSMCIITQHMYWNSHHRKPVNETWIQAGYTSHRVSLPYLYNNSLRKLILFQDGHQWNHSETSTPKHMNMQHNEHIHDTRSNSQWRKYKNGTCANLSNHDARKWHVILGPE